MTFFVKALLKPYIYSRTMEREYRDASDDAKTEEQLPFIEQSGSSSVTTVVAKRKVPAVTTTLLVGLTALCLYLTFRPTNNSLSPFGGYGPHGIVVDNTVFVSSRSEIFTYEPIYAEPPANLTDKAWSELIPQGKGFVSVQKIQEAGVPGAEHLGLQGETAHCVSAFHQLHCLYMLRNGFYAAQDDANDAMPPEHAKHCFDYLRQAIMCSADGSLETYDMEARGVDGYGSTRQCRDYGALYNWTEEFRLTDSHGIH